MPTTEQDPPDEGDYCLALFKYDVMRPRQKWVRIRKQHKSRAEVETEFHDDSELGELPEGHYKQAILMGDKSADEWTEINSREFKVKTVVEHL